MSARGGNNVIVTSGPPLDYSFKELKNCMEIETEEPRGGGKKKTLEKENAPGNETANAEAEPEHKDGPTPGGAAAVVAKGGATQVRVGAAPHKNVVNKMTIAMKLNNNQIETLSYLPQALDAVMDDAMFNLQWIDLSHNHLTTIEPVLTKYANLKAIYLHGNRIKCLPSVERLKVERLPKLISLTLNGNPIEACRIYRRFVIGALHNLRKIDHSTITDDEREASYAWYQMHLKREQLRKQKQQDLADMMAEG
jgi:hypothetical protein